MKIYLIAVISLAISVTISPVILAEEAKEAVEFGNTVCPVSGEAIEPDEEIKYEYEGVIYNFCCKMCLKDFKKDPEKYIAELKAQKEKEEIDQPGETHEHHQGHEHHH